MMLFRGSLISALIMVAARGQDAPATFTIRTNTVVVHVAVATGQRSIPDLQREDFMVLDNGEPRAVSGLAHDQVPIDIVLVCQIPLGDSSPVYWLPAPQHRTSPDREPVLLPPRFRNIQVNYPQRLMNALANVAAGARPEDRVAIVGYGRDPSIALRFTSDRKAIASAIKRFGEAGNGDSEIVTSSEGLAIEYGVRMIDDVERGDPNALVNRRRSIVLISNIFGTGVDYAPVPLIRKLWDRNIVFSIIDDARPTAATTSVQRSDGGESQTILFRRFNPIRIAQATGGDRIVAPDPEHPADVLSPIRQRYTIWFNQPSEAREGETRSIKIYLSETAHRRYPDAVIKARDGYIAR